MRVKNDMNVKGICSVQVQFSLGLFSKDGLLSLLECLTANCLNSPYKIQPSSNKRVNFVPCQLLSVHNFPLVEMIGYKI